MTSCTPFVVSDFDLLKGLSLCAFIGVCFDVGRGVLRTSVGIGFDSKDRLLAAFFVSELHRHLGSSARVCDVGKSGASLLGDMSFGGWIGVVSIRSQLVAASLRDAKEGVECTASGDFVPGASTWGEATTSVTFCDMLWSDCGVSHSSILKAAVPKVVAANERWSLLTGFSDIETFWRSFSFEDDDSDLGECIVLGLLGDRGDRGGDTRPCFEADREEEEGGESGGGPLRGRGVCGGSSALGDTGLVEKIRLFTVLVGSLGLEILGHRSLSGRSWLAR